MKKVLLTSAGFETPRITETFLKLLDKEAKEVKALFIPTAANNPDAISVLPKCMNDLIKVGILSENITVFDLHCNMELDKLREYDVIYFTGGDPYYLIQRINDSGFSDSLKKYIDNGGVYVGVSAGSLVAVNNVPQSLNIVNCTLGVHTPVGTESGIIDTSGNPHIDLTDASTLLILDDKIEIIK